MDTAPGAIPRTSSTPHLADTPHTPFHSLPGQPLLDALPHLADVEPTTPPAVRTACVTLPTPSRTDPTLRLRRHYSSNNARRLRASSSTDGSQAVLKARLATSDPQPVRNPAPSSAHAGSGSSPVGAASAAAAQEVVRQHPLRPPLSSRASTGHGEVRPGVMTPAWQLHEVRTSFAPFWTPFFLFASAFVPELPTPLRIPLSKPVQVNTNHTSYILLTAAYYTGWRALAVQSWCHVPCAHVAGLSSQPTPLSQPCALLSARVCWPVDREFHC